MYTHQYQVGGWGIQNNLNDDDIFHFRNPDKVFRFPEL